MPRNSLVVSAIGLLLWCAGPVRAQPDAWLDQPVRPFTVSVGAFVPMEVPVGETGEVGFSVALGATLKATESCDWRVAMRYSRYSLEDGPKITIWNPLVECRIPLDANRKFWVAPGVGAILGHASDGGGNTTSISYAVGLGYDVADRLFVEARLARGTKRGEHGFIVSIGGRF